MEVPVTPEEQEAFYKSIGMKPPTRAATTLTPQEMEANRAKKPTPKAAAPAKPIIDKNIYKDALIRRLREADVE